MTTLIQFRNAQENANYCGFQLLIDFIAVHTNEDDEIEKVKRQIVLQLGEDGQVLWIQEGEFAIEENYQFRLKNPTGSWVPFRLADAETELATVIELPPDLPSTIEFFSEGFNPNSIESDSDLIAVLPREIKGRLLDLNGKRELEEIQIIVWTSTEVNGLPENFEALFSVETEKKGYFSLPYPGGEFGSAFATVGLPETDQIPIRLNRADDEGPGTFPDKLVLVVDAPAEEECDADCQCQELNVLGEKRVLEEFTFHTVVRTTEPEIKSYELDEEDEITLSEVVDQVPDFLPLIRNSINLLPYTQARLIRPYRPEFAAATVTVPDASLNEWMSSTRVSSSLLRSFLNSEQGLTEENVAELIYRSNAHKLERHLLLKAQAAPGRSQINALNPIDWDDKPTIYQATTIAHGHLLEFKQEWVADGYSLGDLLYSLPLAPGQQKNIVVYDWERRESASNSQQLDYEEQLYNSLGRDRTVSEIVKGSLREESEGRSKASTSSASGGLGLGGIIKGIGGVFGFSGGSGGSSSSAWQRSSRDVSSSSLQRLRDRVVQSANAMRSQRSTVIQTASQGERFEVQSEVIANYNHCHSMTIQYFEVLRHFKVQTRLAGVRECLFIPLEIGNFNLEKALRWRGILTDSLLDPALRSSFEALPEIKDKFKNSTLPVGRYADSDIVDLRGEFFIKFQLARPKDENDEFKPENWHPLLTLFGFNPEDFYNDFLKDQREKDRIFLRELGPRIAEAFVQRMTFHINGTSGELPVEATLVSRFRNNANLRISIRRLKELPGLQRANISTVDISFKDFDLGERLLPEGSKVILTSGHLRYRTDLMDGFIINDRNIQNDIAINGDPRNASISRVPLTSAELANPRQVEVDRANRLIAHLNDNLEYYHQAIWLNMSPERRFMLLDGIMAPCKANGRSVASVVENTLIGVVGNCLVMPVSPGFQLDPTYRPQYTASGEPVPLTDIYKIEPPEPSAITVPTKGVYAEAIMGKCNSCEEIEDQRFWRWHEVPLPSSPTAITPVDTSSRRSEVPNLTPAPLAAPVINLQNAPAAPDPTGVAAALELLGKSDSFRDLTGLSENQKNALAALQASFDTTKNLAQQAASLGSLGAKLDAIKDARKNGLISKEDAQKATKTAIDNPDGKSEAFNNALKNIRSLNELAGDGTISKELADKGKAKILENLIEKDDKAWTSDSVKSLLKAAEGSQESSVKIEENGTVSVEKKGTGRATLSSGSQKFHDFKVEADRPNPTDISFFIEIKSKAEGPLSIDLVFADGSVESFVVPAKQTVKRTFTKNFANNPTTPQIRSGLGDPSVSGVNPASFKFALPIQANTEMVCTQSFHNSPNSSGNTTHVNGDSEQRFAVDLKRLIANDSSVNAHDLTQRSFVICAARDGVVVDTRSGEPDLTRQPTNSDKDNYVLVLHSDGTFAAYSHLKQNSVAVKIGDKVTAEVTKLGEAGNSGFSTGTHLHFSILKRGALNSNNNRSWESIPFVFKGSGKDTSVQNSTYQPIPNGILEKDWHYKRP